MYSGLSSPLYILIRRFELTVRRTSNRNLLDSPLRYSHALQPITQFSIPLELSDMRLFTTILVAKRYGVIGELSIRSVLKEIFAL